MASSLASFFVGIFYDLDPASEKRVNASFDRVKKEALGIGAALTGMGVALKKQSETINDLGMWAEYNKVSLEAANAGELAFEKLGASAGKYRSVIEGLNSVVDQYRQGDAGFLEKWALAGAPAYLLDIADPMERMLAAAKHLQQLTPGSSAARNFADVFGLGYEGAAVMSNPALRNTIAEQRANSNLRGGDQGSAQDYLDNVHEFGNAMDNLGLAFGRLLKGPLGDLLRLATAAGNAVAGSVSAGGTGSNLAQAAYSMVGGFVPQASSGHVYPGGGKAPNLNITLEVDGEVVAKNTTKWQQLQMLIETIGYSATNQ